MNEPTTIQQSSEATHTATESPSTLSRRIANAAWNAAASLLWLYLITKIFFFDIDAFILQRYAPNLQWILAYKFFFFITALGIAVLVFSKWQVIGFLTYLIFYPLLLLFVFLPYAVFKTRSWIVGIAVLNVVIRLFANFKTNVVVSALANSTIDKLPVFPSGSLKR